MAIPSVGCAVPFCCGGAVAKLSSLRRSPAGVRNLGLGGRMPGDGNATAACLLIGRQEKGDRDSAVTVVVHHLGEHGGTVLPAPAVGIRTSRWFNSVSEGRHATYAHGSGRSVDRDVCASADGRQSAGDAYDSDQYLRGGGGSRRQPHRGLRLVQLVHAAIS
jgi:hypothetical protein